MKKLFALILTLALLLSATAALAASESITLKYLGNSKIALDSGAALKGYEATYKGPDTTVTVAVTDRVTGKTYDVGAFAVKDGGTFSFDMRQYGAFSQIDKPRAMRVTLTTASGYKKSTTVYQVAEKEGGAVYLKQLRPTYYADNTATSFGPHLRDLTPGLTDLWYMVTPLDLSKQGRQTYELVAGNLNVIGEVYVDVAGDAVTISYYNYYDDKGGQTKTTKEFVTLFHDYAEITAATLARADSEFAFNVPVSVQRDLGGDTTVLMLVVNHVDYCNFPTSKDMLRRFWENTPENKAKREALVRLIDWDGANDPA